MKKPSLFFIERSDSKIFFSQRKKNSPFLLLFGLIFIIISGFLIVLIRLFQITIVKGNYYQKLSEKNRMKELYLEAPRGKIFDRKGLLIAESLNPDFNKNTDWIESQRLYNEKEAVSHLIGFVQIADKNDLKNDHCLPKLKLGDKIGKKGVEKLFDCQLRGVTGKKIIEVNALGKHQKTLGLIKPQVGKSIVLSVDLELQKKAYQLIKDKKGAIVATKPQTGEILVLVSSPSFNPENIRPSLEDKDKPLLNRATEGLYPPGSIFKLIVAVAGLEEKKIIEKTEFEDKGILEAGPLKFGNWYFLQYGKTEGMVNVVKAVQRSNDIFFYQAGALTGPEKIKLWAERFGYGKTFDNFLTEQSAGQIPSPFWKKEVFNQDWYLGDTYNLSIGQGETLVNPLQVNLATAVFSNNGYLCQPQLLKIKNQPTEKVNPNCKKIFLSQKTLELVREGMKRACFTGGTGWPLFDFRVKDQSQEKKQTRLIQTGCKTGTAESQSKDHLPHAWITVFAPYESPEIVLTVLVENGGQGSDVAGPIAREVLKVYFEKEE